MFFALVNKYFLFFSKSNSGGSLTPDEKHQILVYHHPTALKRDDSNRSSNRSSTFSREAVNRGSARSLKEEQGGMKIYNLARDESTRGSGRRMPHEGLMYRSIEPWLVEKKGVFVLIF